MATKWKINTPYIVFYFDQDLLHLSSSIYFDDCQYQVLKKVLHLCVSHIQYLADLWNKAALIIYFTPNLAYLSSSMIVFPNITC